MITKRDGKYRVKVYYRSRYITSRTFSRKSAAEDWERKTLDALHAGTWRDDRGINAVTIEEWAAIWLKTKIGGKPSARIDRERSVRVHVVPAFGKRPLSTVSHSEVATWARELATRRSPSIARRALATLRLTYQLAMRDGAAQRNPAEGIKLPTQQPGEARPLTHAQLHALSKAMPSEKFKLLILVLGYGGLRWGEASALQVKHLDERGRLRVLQSWSEAGGPMSLGDVKNHQARTVPLPPSITVKLQKYAEKMKPDDFIFHASEPNIPLRNSNFRHRQFDPAVKQIGLRGVTPHCLRDTAASLAISAGANVLAVSKMLGHKDPSVTLKHYAALFPNELEDIADRLDAAMQEEGKPM